MSYLRRRPWSQCVVHAHMELHGKGGLARAPRRVEKWRDPTHAGNTRHTEFAPTPTDPLRAEHIEVGSRCSMSDALPTFDDLGTVRDVTASGVRLRVVERGTGPKLVLLHSLFMDHTTWDGVASELAKDFCVITPDLPGYGESEKPPTSRFG